MQSSRLLWLSVGALWLALLTWGWHVLLRHEFTPGSSGQVSERWPRDSRMSLASERPTLVLFAHRNCPCTRATLQELEQTLLQTGERARVFIVLLTPEDAATDRVGGDIEERARSLSGGEVAIDPKGIEARRFRIRTSGHVLLYGADGRLLFSGGITDSRGHLGESVGSRALLAHLRGDESTQKIVPVFGCPLFADDVEE